MAEGLAGKTLFITGGSRGIGLAIAVRAARDGANVALLAKTAEPHPKLPGTVYTAAEEIEAAGGTALPIVGDVRDADAVAAAVEQAAERFGGIDVCVNNASAISLGTDRADRAQALRPDAEHQRARDLPGDAGVHPAPQALGQRPHPDPLAAGQPRPAVARRPRRLHAGRSTASACLRSAPPRSCARRVSPPTACGRARSSPPPPCRTCWAATRQWGRRGPGDLRRLRLPRDHAARPRVHRPDGDRRRGAHRGGDHRPRAYPAGPAGPRARRRPLRRPRAAARLAPSAWRTGP